MKQLTKSDKRNLDMCPTDVWFDAIDVFPRVKRATYSLGRLVEAGFLESRVIGKLSNTKTEYFKKATHGNT